jgi:hypothetical protein
LNFKEIRQLNELLPLSLTPTANLDGGLRSFRGTPTMTATEHRNFHLAYTCPSFGWEAASMLCERGRKRFPMTPNSASMTWVYKTFVRMRLGDKAKYGDEFRPILDAHAIFKQEGGSTMRPVIEAALLTQPEKCKEVEIQMGLFPRTLEAYDALFYAVRDRKADHMLLRQLVYPMTPLEEQLEDYLTIGRIETQLKRTAYNKGLDSTLYFAGFRKDILGGLDESQASNLFKRAVMIQATLLAEHGFLNFTKLHPAIISGKSLVQSRMLGGQDQSDAGYNDTFLGMSAETLFGDSQSLQQLTREKAGINLV